MTQPAKPEPVRRDHLPTTPPPEYEFFRWVDGDTLVVGDRPRVNGHPVPVVRRLVTYGDWEPVTPAHWAAAEPPRHGGHAGATRPTSPTDEGQPVQAHASPARGRTAAQCDALCADIEADRDRLREEADRLRGQVVAGAAAVSAAYTLANTWDTTGEAMAADELRDVLDRARTNTEEPGKTPPSRRHSRAESA